MTDLDMGPLVAGHQPNFMPWFGYFEKMLKCDIFVHSDDVQYPKQSYTNRVKMLVANTATYITLPVKKGGDRRIADKRYVQDEQTSMRLLKSLRLNLGGLPYFGDIEPVIAEFKEAYWRYQTVADFNIHMNQYLAALMGIETIVRRGTELGLEEFHRNERLVKRCRLLGSTAYLCGQGADGYQDEAFLAASGLELRRIDYDIGRTLFGDDLPYTVLQGIARRGLDSIRTAIAAYRHGMEA